MCTKLRYRLRARYGRFSLLYLAEGLSTVLPSSLCMHPTKCEWPTAIKQTYVLKFYGAQCELNSRVCVHRLMIHSVLQASFKAKSSIAARPSHVFQCTQEKSGRPGQFGNVMIMYLPPFLPLSVEMVADV